MMALLLLPPRECLTKCPVPVAPPRESFPSSLFSVSLARRLLAPLSPRGATQEISPFFHFQSWPSMPN